jgi:hypothetical protein
MRRFGAVVKARSKSESGWISSDRYFKVVFCPYGLDAQIPVAHKVGETTLQCVPPIGPTRGIHPTEIGEKAASARGLVVGDEIKNACR